jgi:prephenate dehydrogenase
MAAPQNVVVAGCNGQFGTIFAGKLAADGLQVVGIDTGATADRPELLSNYLSADIAQPGQAALALLAAADCILLCVPEAVVLAAIPAVCRAAKPDAVIVDISSIKTRIEAAVRRAAPRAAYLSIHPMFGPLPSFEARNICLVPLAENASSAWFANLLEKWKAKVTTLSAAEHDRNAAYIQSLTHAALLEVAATLQRSGLPFETISALSTPVQRALLALCARIVSASDPALYWDIQSANPFAAQARLGFDQARKEFSAIVERADHEAFAKLFGEIAAYLGPALPSLIDLSEDIVELGKGET